MMVKKNARMHKVKQIITTDSIGAANNLIEGGKWILLQTYRSGGLNMFMLGRVADYDESESIPDVVEEFLRKQELIEKPNF